jgi:hypothetical protein
MASWRIARRRILQVIPVVLASILILCIRSRIIPRAQPLAFPAQEAIQNITVTIYQHTARAIPAIAEFQIPNRYVPLILAAFRPAEVWDYGSFSEQDLTFGRLIITTRQGQRTTVTFCDGGKCPLCFSVDGVRCVRRGLFKPITVGNGIESFADEGWLLYRTLQSIHEVMTKGHGQAKLQEEIEDLERSRGERPPKRRNE